jgi:1,2-dihydroxy-3-keto-5-methylthiopentene dioxygenase
MTRLATFAAEGGPALETTSDPDRIAAVLAHEGVSFERWATRGAAGDAILDAYREEVARLSRDGGYATADVVAMKPDHPERAAMRAKFLDEHTHGEDEVRFFVEGRGAFYLRFGPRVHQVVCEAGDLLSVPAGTRHWFDMGPKPLFTAIRLFTNPEGWVAQFTGDPIAAKLPRFE